MDTLAIEGGKPLSGFIKPAGSRNSALKLIYAALFSSEEVVLENVPDVISIDEDLAVIRSIGAMAEWSGNNRLIISGAGISSYEVPQEIGSRYRTAMLIAGPLLYRFGKALLPKYLGEFSEQPYNRLLDTWESLGIKVIDTGDHFLLDGSEAKGGQIHFKIPSHIGTDNAILSSIFANGETEITNASEEGEVEDLINFCRLIGADISNPEPKKIKIKCASNFKGAKFLVQPDKIEIATFAILAILTQGNITIQGVNKTVVIPLVHLLDKMGAKFAFEGNDLKVWSNGEILSHVNVDITPTPGINSAWQSMVTLLLTQANGESFVHDTVTINGFGFVKDLNRMGARINLAKPTEVGLVPVISDELYDLEKMGEPLSVARVEGPTKLKGTRLEIFSIRGRTGGSSIGRRGEE